MTIMLLFEGLWISVLEISNLGNVGYSHDCHWFTIELFSRVHIYIVVHRRVLMNILLHTFRVKRRMGTLAEQRGLRRLLRVELQVLLNPDSHFASSNTILLNGAISLISVCEGSRITHLRLIRIARLLESQFLHEYLPQIELLMLVWREWLVVLTLRSVGLPGLLEAALNVAGVPIWALQTRVPLINLPHLFLVFRNTCCNARLNSFIRSLTFHFLGKGTRIIISSILREDCKLGLMTLVAHLGWRRNILRSRTHTVFGSAII